MSLCLAVEAAQDHACVPYIGALWLPAQYRESTF